MSTEWEDFTMYNRSFLFLGTGAADWSVPTESGEFRRYSSMLAYDRVLRDDGAVFLTHMARTLPPAGRRSRAALPGR